MLNKKMQIGLLYSFYLARAGTATVHDAAKELKIPEAFLAQVAWKLKKKDLIVSHKGPGGGYKLTPGITIYDVVTALGNINTLKNEELQNLMRGNIEHRVLASFAASLDAYIYPIYDYTIVKAVQKIINAELMILDKMPIPDKLN